VQRDRDEDGDTGGEKDRERARQRDTGAERDRVPLVKVPGNTLYF